MMRKHSSRKHGTQKKIKARAHHSAKPHSRRGASTLTAPMEEARPESESVGDEPAPQSESLIAEENPDDEAGIYGTGRGETAG
jgi:hypothetical protein